jgi:outer membrane protein assembly factor BamB
MSGDIAWVTETSGETTTSPAGLGGTIYIVDDTELQAIDVQDGSEIWTTNVDCEFTTTPVVDETTVFVGGEDGSLAAIDANGGETRWTKEICNEIEAAPAVANGVVVVGNAGLWDEHNALHALDAQDGSIKWSFGDTRFSIQSAPVVVGETVISGYGGRLYALDMSSGDENWSVKLRGDSLSAPAIANETIFVESNKQYLYALTTNNKK